MLKVAEIIAVKTLRKTYTINASPDKVYEALTDERIISYWSESPAKMDISVNGKFSLWDDSIYGMNKYISESKIIQEWYEKGWKEPSIVTFNLRPKDGMTVLELIHENIPDESYEDIVSGWDKHYIHPMAEMVEQLK